MSRDFEYDLSFILEELDEADKLTQREVRIKYDFSFDEVFAEAYTRRVITEKISKKIYTNSPRNYMEIQFRWSPNSCAPTIDNEPLTDLDILSFGC
jgi:hypothetical protein